MKPPKTHSYIDIDIDIDKQLSLSLIKVVPLFFRESDCDLKEEELDLIMSMLDSFFSKGFKAAKWSVSIF